MKFHKFTAAEKAAYRAGKIRAYYQNKNKCKKTPGKKPRYSSFDANEAFARALERTYGAEAAKDYMKSLK